MNFVAVLIAALVPMALGFVWYNPKTLGTAWMQHAGMTEEKMKGSKMGLIFGLSFIFALMLAMTMNPLVIHQMGVTSSLFYEMQSGDQTRIAAAKAISDQFTGTGIYAEAGRTFKHGVFHGVLYGIFLVLPVFATNALFERKTFKYVAINVGYWIVCLGIMGGIISAMR